MDDHERLPDERADGRGRCHCSNDLLRRPRSRRRRPRGGRGSTRPGEPRRARGDLRRPLGRAGDVRVRPLEDPRAGLLHRHPAADGLRLPARRPRLLLHAHRRRRALPAHARPRGVLPHGLGRQRPAHRAAGPELLRRPLRPHAPLRRGLRAPARGWRGQVRQGRRPGAGEPSQLHRAVRAPDRRGREAVRGAVAPARALGRLGAALPDHRRAVAHGRAARVPAQPRPRRGVPGRGAGAVGRDVPDGGRAGRARGARLPRALPQGRVPPRRAGHARRRRTRLHRDHASRAARRVRRARRAPGRRALPAPVRHDGALAAVRRRAPRPRPPRRRARQGRGHRDVLHVRRPHRRAVVARAAAPDAVDHHARRPHRARDAGLDHVALRPGRVRRDRGQDDVLRAPGRRRRPAGRGRPRRRARADAAQGELLREGRQAARDRRHPPVVHHQRRARRRPEGEAA